MTDLLTIGRIIVVGIGVAAFIAVVVIIVKVIGKDIVKNINNHLDQ